MLVSVHDGLIDQPLCVLFVVLDRVCDHCAMRQDVPDRMQAGHPMNKGDQGQRRCDIRQINAGKDLSEFGDQRIEVPFPEQSFAEATD